MAGSKPVSHWKSEISLSEMDDNTIKFGSNFESEKKPEKRSRGSGDWLGLKDEESSNRPGSGKAGKGRLLEELFGDSPLISKPRQESDGGYMPSASQSSALLLRRPLSSRQPFETGRATTPLTANLSGKPASDLGKTADDFGLFNELEQLAPSLSQSATSLGWLAAGTGQPAADTGHPAAKPDQNTNVIQSPARIPGPMITSGDLPDWLTGDSGRRLNTEKQEAEALVTEKLMSQNDENKILPTTSPMRSANNKQMGEENIMRLLENVQDEISSAVAKRNQTLHDCLKVLMFETQKVLSGPMASEKIRLFGTDSTTNKSLQATLDTTDYNDMVKQGEDALHKAQMSLKEQELENSRLQLEMENLKATHEIEMEMLRKNHSCEMSAAEGRFSRLKSYLEEIEKEYKEKITRLKEKEESLIAEQKERLERAEEARLAELNKLGELHQAALQQAASLSLPYNNTGRVVKIPLMSVRPKDDTELSEREASLLEREKHLEAMKALLEEEKEEVEIAKILKAERMRELERKEKESKQKEEARQADAAREREQLDTMASRIKVMRAEALREQGELAKVKFELAAERARLEAVYSIQGRADTSVPPLDMIQGQLEVEAAIEAAREAKDAAEQERRKHAQLRQTLDGISWEQKELELKLDNREKHLMKMLENAEKIRDEGFAALEEAKILKEDLSHKEIELQAHIKKVEAQERILSKERLDIAREKIELERRRSQLDIFLPDLTTADDLPLNAPRVYVDPKAVILRLKAEKEFETTLPSHTS